MPVNYGVSFDGRRIVHPGAYSAIDASQMVVSSPEGFNIPVLVGEADSGTPHELKWFTSPEQARKYVKGDDLYKAIQLAFSPTPEGGGGASVVGVYITNSLTKAKGNIGGVDFTALEYGEGGNRIQIGIGDGSITGSKKLTAFRWDTEVTEIYDNVGALFLVEYVGADAYAVLDCDGTTITTTTGADSTSATLDLSIDLTADQYGTLQDVIDYINGIPEYTAKPVTTKNLGLKIDSADIASAVDITTEKPVLGLDEDLLYQVNNLSQLVEAAIASTSSVTNAALTYLSGGTKGTTDATWVNYFEDLKSHFYDVLVPLTEDETVHAEALSHTNNMLTRHQRQIVITGGGIGETVERAKRRAQALNNSRAVSVYPGIYHESTDGKTPLPAYLTAALIAGRICGIDIADPVTFDYFGVLGLENELLAGDPDIEDLITSGVCTLERVQNGGVRLVHGITTYLGSNNTLYREISVRRTADNISETMRSVMESKFVGRKGTRATLASITTTAIDVLEKAVKDEQINGYKNIKVRFENSVVYIDYQVAPVEPINFILITSHFVPESL